MTVELEMGSVAVVADVVVSALPKGWVQRTFHCCSRIVTYELNRDLDWDLAEDPWPSWPQKGCDPPEVPHRVLE